MKKIMTAALMGLMAASFSPALARDVEETRDLSDYSKIKVDGLANLVVEVGDNYSFKVEGDDDMVEFLRTRVRGKTLVIDFDDNDREKNISFFSLSDLKVKITITMPALEGLEIDGLVDAYINGIDSRDFELEIDGKADVELRGKCETADIEIDGWADVDAREFKCENVDIELDGMGDADVYASKSVRASADGMGDIVVFGNPAKTDIDEDGFASVKIRK